MFLSHNQFITSAESSRLSGKPWAMWLRFSPPPPAGESSSQNGVMLTPTLSPPKLSALDYANCLLTHLWAAKDTYLAWKRFFIFSLWHYWESSAALFVCLWPEVSSAIHVTGAAVQTFLQEVNATLRPLPCSMLQTQHPQPESVFKQCHETPTMQRGHLAAVNHLPCPSTFSVFLLRLTSYFSTSDTSESRRQSHEDLSAPICVGKPSLTSAPTKEKRHEACNVHASQIAVKPHGSVGNL